MSAYTIGSTVAPVDDAGNRSATPPPKSSAPAAFVKWIPGEAVTFYAAVIGLGAAQGDLTGDETPAQVLERIDAGSWQWFLVGLAIAVVLVVAGAIAERTQKSVFIPGLLVRILLAAIAFTVWTSALPGSWPYSWHWIRDMGGAYVLLLVPISVAFAAIAESITRKANL